MKTSTIPTLFLLFFLGVGECSGPVYVSPEAEAVNQEPKDGLITQTVYGFLDFTTTIANTVMVFSPQSQPPVLKIKPTPTLTISKTKPPTSKSTSIVEIKQPIITSSKVEVKEGPLKTVSSAKIVSQQGKNLKTEHKKQTEKVSTQIKPVAKSLAQLGTSSRSEVKITLKPDSSAKPKIISTKVEVLSSSSDEPVVIENHLDQGDLSKQPSEVVEETYKVVDIAPTTKLRGGVTGLVTKLGGTIVKEGTTTVHETSVIGTYISGKYAQILKSASHIIQKSPTPTIHKTASINLKTKLPVEPSSVLEDGLPLEALFTTPLSQNLVRQTRRPAVSPPFKNKLQRTRVHQEVSSEQSPRKPTSASNTRHAFKLTHNRFNRQSSSEIPTVSVFSDAITPTRRYHRPRSQSSSVTSNNIETGSRRFKPKPSPVTTNDQASTSLYKFKLTRPQGRWQYKSSPKPRVAIRRQDEDAPGQPTPTLPELEQSEVEDESSEILPSASPTPTLPIQTIKVDISTPADFSNIYYEIATIKSPYTFQVGTVKNTRYITVTSTLEKFLIDPSETLSSEPLTENILTTKPVYDKDASVATLPPIAIGGEESLPLETTIETFSTSEILLKTHLLPVVRESNTTTMTLVQTYEVTKLVTATKTLPPTELFQFIPSKTLNEFNTRLDEAGSELHLELEFGDSGNDEDDGDEIPLAKALPNNTAIEVKPSSVNVMTSFSSSSVNQLQEQLTPERLQQLAFLRLLNPNQQQLPVVTSTPVLSIQTLYESHIIPVFNGLSTVLSTISRPVGTVTSTHFATSTLPVPSLPIPLFPTQPILQPQITSTPILTQTVVTETQSQVLKLTFGAKTAYTTLYSTKVVPTVLTTYLTAQVPIQPTQQFPSFFPPPYNPFSFVG